EPRTVCLGHGHRRELPTHELARDRMREHLAEGRLHREGRTHLLAVELDLVLEPQVAARRADGDRVVTRLDHEAIERDIPVRQVAPLDDELDRLALPRLQLDGCESAEPA